MREHEVETWVHNLVERIESNEPIEDSRVELKSKWIEDENAAARRIAGHANAARGALILWVIGLDEKKGVVGAKHQELATWLPKVEAQFDELAPRLIMDLNIPVDGKTLVALLFETARAPYVVKNPKYGMSDGGPVAWEVPWRKGTSVRTAKRVDLLRLLSPLQEVPEFEILDGEFSLQPERGSDRLLWRLELTLYALTTSYKPIAIPFHKCRGQFHVPAVITSSEFSGISLQPPRRTGLVSVWRVGDPEPYRPRNADVLSMTIDATEDEVVITGPGRLFLTAEADTPPLEDHLINSNAHISIQLVPIGAEREIPMEAELIRDASQEPDTVRWTIPNAYPHRSQ